MAVVDLLFSNAESLESSDYLSSCRQMTLVGNMVADLHGEGRHVTGTASLPQEPDT